MSLSNNNKEPVDNFKFVTFAFVENPVFPQAVLDPKKLVPENSEDDSE